MFTLFFNLYFSMFYGQWREYTLTNIGQSLKSSFNGIGNFLTSIFGDNQMTTLGDVLFVNDIIGYPTWMSLIAFVLALITSIGIVVMAVKGIKRVFGVFFMGIR